MIFHKKREEKEEKQLRPIKNRFILKHFLSDFFDVFPQICKNKLFWKFPNRNLQNATSFYHSYFVNQSSNLCKVYC